MLTSSALVLVVASSCVLGLARRSDAADFTWIGDARTEFVPSRLMQLREVRQQTGEDLEQVTSRLKRLLVEVMRSKRTPPQQQRPRKSDGEWRSHSLLEIVYVDMYRTSCSVKFKQL